jgi:hypothetical protein
MSMPGFYQESYKGWDVYRVCSSVYYALRNDARIDADSKTNIMRAIAARVIEDLEARVTQLEQSVMTLAAEPKTADKFRFTTHTRTASPIVHGTNCGCCALVAQVRSLSALDGSPLCLHGKRAHMCRFAACREEFAKK